jgi:DMSO reductase anchor subunit/ferredoxin
VLAYEKDPVTGIVVHLDDQCIGCGYCVLKCPYDVPKFSERLGIVRKCDMCHGRLAAGEAPACAQACPTHAIRIVTVQNRKPETGSRITRPNPDRLGFELSGVRFPQSGIADPAYTQPTTRYVSKRQLPPDLAAADVTALRVQPAHWPLVLMLTAMPAAVGLQLAVALPLLVGARLRAMPSASAIANTLAPTPDQQNLLLIAAILGAMGLFASVFHLGQPWRAWRIFLGWRKSWLSREAMLFAPWFALTSAIPILHWSLDIGHWSFPVAAACLGVAGLTCSAMIYVDTHRQFWRATQTFPRFFGTAVLVAATLLAPAVAALLLVAKLGWETRTQSGGSPSARLQNGPLRPLATARVGLALATSVLLVVIPGPWLLVPLLAGELAERLLFFRAVDAPKMPGVPSA